MELDDILNEREKREAEKIRKHAEGEISLERKADSSLATYMKSADEIILPILRDYEAKLIERGYTAKIIVSPIETISGRQFYDKIIFSFANEKSVNYVTKTIIFEMYDDANVLIKFIGEGQPKAKECAISAPAVKSALLKFFKVAFR